MTSIVTIIANTYCCLRSFLLNEQTLPTYLSPTANRAAANLSQLGGQDKASQWVHVRHSSV